MSQTFPTSIPNYPDTTGSETLNSAGNGKGLSGILDDYGLDITAIANKVGTNASTPIADRILIGTGTGVSEWGNVISSLTFTGIPYIQGDNGTIAITADTDGAQYNFSVTNSGTLAFYGSAGATLNLKLLDGQLILATSNTPASATATGETGQIAWDSNYIYICVNTDTWKRVAISTW